MVQVVLSSYGWRGGGNVGDPDTLTDSAPLLRATEQFTGSALPPWQTSLGENISEPALICIQRQQNNDRMGIKMAYCFDHYC